MVEMIIFIENKFLETTYNHINDIPDAYYKYNGKSTKGYALKSTLDYRYHNDIILANLFKDFIEDIICYINIYDLEGQKDYFDVYEVCGSTITLWRDINRLEADLLKLSPLDKRAIKRFIKDIKSVQKMIVPSECPVNLMNLIQLTKQLWSMRGMIKVLMLEMF